MKLFSKAKDFISPNEELKETLESSVKELLDGRILADKVIRRNIVFYSFLTFWGYFILPMAIVRKSSIRKK